MPTTDNAATGGISAVMIDVAAHNAAITAAWAISAGRNGPRREGAARGMRGRLS
ncbi:hypothetical protein JCM12141A_57690 [Mycolicibacterium hodleri]